VNTFFLKKYSFREKCVAFQKISGYFRTKIICAQVSFWA